MDGLKLVVPNSCVKDRKPQYNLFSEEINQKEKCIGCQKNDIFKHNGKYCEIMDWKNNKKFSSIKLDGSIKEEKLMEFNTVVGNPPYQELISSSKDNSSLGKQLFPYFIMLAETINPNYCSLITPSRWFKGDAQDKSFIKLREFMSKHNNIKEIYNFPISNDIFNKVVIKGGVNYFLAIKNYNGVVQFYETKNGQTAVQNRPLFEEGLDVVLSSSLEHQIINKVKKHNFISLTSITKGRNAFGIVGKADVINNISSSEYFEGSIKLQCKNDTIRWTLPESVTKNIEVFKKYKVFISKSAGNPASDFKVIGKPYVAFPNEACTDSLIPIGCFDNEQEANNLQKYMKTKFLRYLISVLKVSQNVCQNVYQFVPVQDFTNSSDISWDKTISEIDKQLYEKYNFTSKEINMIENKIKTME